MVEVRKLSTEEFLQEHHTLTPEKRAEALALLRDPTKALELAEKAKQRIDTAFGYDPDSPTEWDDMGLTRRPP